MQLEPVDGLFLRGDAPICRLAVPAVVVAGMVEADDGHRDAVDDAQVAPFLFQHAPGASRDRPADAVGRLGQLAAAAVVARALG
jgi:hypothetical protein